MAKPYRGSYSPPSSIVLDGSRKHLLLPRLAVVLLPLVLEGARGGQGWLTHPLHELTELDSFVFHNERHYAQPFVFVNTKFKKEGEWFLTPLPRGA